MHQRYCFRAFRSPRRSGQFLRNSDGIAPIIGALHPTSRSLASGSPGAWWGSCSLESPRSTPARPQSSSTRGGRASVSLARAFFAAHSAQMRSKPETQARVIPLLFCHSLCALPLCIAVYPVQFVRSESVRVRLQGRVSACPQSASHSPGLLAIAQGASARYSKARLGRLCKPALPFPK